MISTQFDEVTYKAARNVQPVLLNTASEVNTEQLLAFQKDHRDQRSFGQTGGEIGMNEPTNLIQNIRLTEKASLLGEKNNQYVFRVDPRANKVADQAGDRGDFRQEGCPGQHCPVRREEEARTPG